VVAVIAVALIATTAEAFTTSWGITLRVSAPSSVPTGANETITISLTNLLPVPRQTRYTGFPNLPHGLYPYQTWYVLPLNGGCTYGPTGPEPAFIVIYNESGAPVQLNVASPSLVTCAESATSASGASNYYQFAPFQSISESVSIGGHWTSQDASEPWINATYSSFAPGIYTIVAFDLWGQTASLNFTVKS
jgi:hypothetical protein